MRRILISCLVLFVLAQFIVFGVDRTPWFDVAFSVETVHKMHQENIDFSQYDVHPGTYYHVLYGWSFLNPGFTEYHWAQELSVLFGLIFLFFVGLGLKEIFSERMAFLVTLSMAFLTTYLHYSTEVRMYILVLAMSAVMFYALSRDFDGWWLWIACLMAFLLPLTHYMAVMVVGVFMVLWWLKSKKERWKVFPLVLAGSVGSMVAIFVYLIPQRERIIGMWLPTSTLGSWPSSLLFTFFMTDGIVPSVFASVIYLSFLVIMILLAFWIYRNVGKSWEKNVIVIMVLTAILPILGLIFSTKIQLYHHRFFLVATWMFAVATLLLFWGVVLHWWRKGRRFFAAVILLLLVIVIGGMFYKYVTQQPMELQRMIDATPCRAGVTVVHESPFSSLPFEVYNRERGCGWRNVVSTDLNEMMSHSAGFDVVPAENIYWEQSVPEEEFYYIQAGFNLMGNRSFDVVKQDEGVRLVLVR